MNGSLKVYGVVMKDGAPVGEHSLLAEFEYENCTGYISLSTSEAGYFGIDNLRVTKIDGWTQAQIDGYENFKTIADEAAPTVLNAPVWTVTARADGAEATGTGKNITAAQQEAAKKLLSILSRRKD